MASGLLVMGLMVSCKKDSFLNRAPLSNISPQTFFTNEPDLQLYCNQYYTNLPVQTFLRADDNSDDKANATINTLLAGTYTVPGTASANDLPGTGAYSAGTATINGTAEARILKCNMKRPHHKPVNARLMVRGA